MDKYAQRFGKMRHISTSKSLHLHLRLCLFIVTIINSIYTNLTIGSDLSPCCRYWYCAGSIANGITGDREGGGIVEIGEGGSGISLTCLDLRLGTLKHYRDREKEINGVNSA